jgi:hypothetical protein
MRRAERIPSSSERTSLDSPPAKLTGESYSGKDLLSWEPVPGAVEYLVSRATYKTAKLPFSIGAGDTKVPVLGKTRQIGRSVRPIYAAASDGSKSLYYVQAVDEEGRVSAPSNLTVVAAGSSSALGYRELLDRLEQIGKGSSAARAAAASLIPLAARSRESLARRKFDDAREALDVLRTSVSRNEGGALAASDAEDLNLAVSKLLGRIGLAQAGTLPIHALDPSP